MWIQFSVWDEKWPYRVITDFLSPLERDIIPRGIRWHFLYEPNLLVRVESTDLGIIEKAFELARKLNYRTRVGDISKPLDDRTGDVYFQGEMNFYGSLLWDANADFLWATSRLIIRMYDTGQLTPKMLRKHIHLLCNQSGRNYLQEFWLVLRHALRSFRLFLKYGFN